MFVCMYVCMCVKVRVSQTVCVRVSVCVSVYVCVCARFRYLNTTPPHTHTYKDVDVYIKLHVFFVVIIIIDAQEVAERRVSSSSIPSHSIHNAAKDVRIQVLDHAFAHPPHSGFPPVVSAVCQHARQSVT
jgi:hypothetical protein